MMKPEDKARVKIDGLLQAAGWSVQDYRELSLGASLGVVVRNFPLKSSANENNITRVRVTGIR